MTSPAMTTARNTSSTAVWYVIAGTFSLVGAVFVLPWGNVPLAVAAILLTLGAVLLVAVTVALARDARAGRSGDEM